MKNKGRKKYCITFINDFNKVLLYLFVKKQR